VLHEAVTPRRPACKVIYIHLLGKAWRRNCTVDEPLPAVRCSSIHLWTRSSSSGHLAFSPRLAFFVFLIAVRLTSAIRQSLTSFSLTPNFLSAARLPFRLHILLTAVCNLQNRVFFLAAFCLCSVFLGCL